MQPTTDLFEQNLYPYFDRGLGCIVESKSHRKQICKERGLVPIEGTTDLGDPFDVAKDAREADEEIAAADEYMDRIENDPNLAAYREARDRGQFNKTFDKVGEQP